MVVEVLLGDEFIHRREVTLINLGIEPADEGLVLIGGHQDALPSCLQPGAVEDTATRRLAPGPPAGFATRSKSEMSGLSTTSAADRARREVRLRAGSGRARRLRSQLPAPWSPSGSATCSCDPRQSSRRDSATEAGHPCR